MLALFLLWEMKDTIRECKTSAHRKFGCVHVLGSEALYNANVKHPLIGSLIVFMFWEARTILRECKASAHRKFDCVHVLGSEGHTTGM